MCGRFTLGKPENIEKRFKTSNKLTGFDASWNVAPSQMLPTIKRSSPNKIVMMKWGLMFNKNTKGGPINIRSESTKEKPYFKGRNDTIIEYNNDLEDLKQAIKTLKHKPSQSL